MNLIRVIEEFNNSDEKLNEEYVLDITPEIMLEILIDLVLNEDDYPYEVYDTYPISQDDIQKLKPFLKKQLKEDFSKYSYYISCYELD